SLAAPGLGQAEAGVVAGAGSGGVLDLLASGLGLGLDAAPQRSGGARTVAHHRANLPLGRSGRPAGPGPGGSFAVAPGRERERLGGGGGGCLGCRPPRRRGGGGPHRRKIGRASSRESAYV